MIQWLPPTMQNEGARIPISLEFFVSHLMLFQPKLVFLEIGANDGVTNDPIYPLVKRFGWTGIVVEPLPGPYEELRKNYARFPQVHLANVAIGDFDGEKTLYKLREYEGQYAQASQLSSFDRQIVANRTEFVRNAPNEIEEMSVPCLTIESLLQKFPVGAIDILIIDAEGYDAKILRMIDFSRMHPAIIQYEHASMDKHEREDIAKLLTGKEYRLFSDNLDTVAYKAPEYFGWAERGRLRGQT
jgi:FkbM family methyltransferase